jgi:hypothetical protein
MDETIQPIAKESLSEALDLTNQRITVAIEEEQAEQGYKELTDVAAHTTEHCGKLPSPQWKPAGNLTAQRRRIGCISVETLLQPGPEPGDVANGGGQCVGSLRKVRSKASVSIDEFVLYEHHQPEHRHDGNRDDQERHYERSGRAEASKWDGQSAI